MSEKLSERFAALFRVPNYEYWWNVAKDRRDIATDALAAIRKTKEG